LKNQILFDKVDFSYPSRNDLLLRAISRGMVLTEKKTISNFSLEVNEGDRIGLIGGNGAGKTTILRLAAGILKPDHGSVKTYSPTTSLISTSFGVDLELSGLDNIRKKARYMSYSKRELDSYLDQIIDFSGLGSKILDSVRTYSDGMRIRLITSIVLILARGCVVMDEGIAAADLEFTDKVENSLENFYKRIPIVLIASHSLHFLEKTCDKVIYLVDGEIKFIGNPQEAWSQYVKDVYKLE
jgi:ABC-type polysaccharide/polyol phosphate transport system ATPase subunit